MKSSVLSCRVQESICGLGLPRRGIGTLEAARMLAKHYGVATRDVGYSGLKDRWGETSQWFSLRTSHSAEKI